MSRSEPIEQTPGSFARTLLHSEVIAERYVADTSQDEVELADYTRYPDTDGFGGWSQYHNATIESEQPLKDTESTGRRADSMSRQELLFGDETTGAYVTNYAGSEPKMRQAHSQMAVWAFCDTLGLNVPRHHWYPEAEILVVKEVGGPDEIIEDPISIDPSVANHIDSDALLDYISVQLLAGTADLLPNNFKIGEEGQVYIFDFDKSVYEFSNSRLIRGACGKAMKTVNTLNQVRDDDLSIDRDQIHTRVQEIATAIHSSEHFSRILNIVELYDELFLEHTGEPFRALFENNIEVFSNPEN